MRKYQYDDAFFTIADELNAMRFLEYEDEEAFARQLEYGRY